MFFSNEKVCVYGITGRYGSYHTKKMIEYGTDIVCGVSKNNEFKEVHNVPVYNTLSDYVSRGFNVDTAIFFVPAPYVMEAFLDAFNNGVKKFVVITEHVPIHDALRMVDIVKKNNLTMVGPNCPGVIYSKEKVKLGIMPEKYFKEGEVAIISRSGTLMYEIAKYIGESYGVSIGIGLGGDPVIGLNVLEAFKEVAKLGFEKVVLIGEIGGEDEITGVAEAIKMGFKPSNIVSFFAGRHAPEGKRMGHAGAIVEGEHGKIKYKEEKMREYGVRVVKFPWEVKNAFAL
ncbi:succinate--CoA ligase subunit alpha [Fervidobacterium nodosum]|uniref:CoA-binding domain protein n=1 Tax=Fervidobacterium nodosum (strain ATCC 35602 / DSM 5306 / Rt17-B1) TaxID=381764 RepID=A7HMU3_FERNB|nr:CoA-binding protein [Fervidobacterium nodosum]ABS61226.1 CoA-binding domain protein [Fervidobacterium nodosum Rt17-B1]PHJ13960.1 CoA-binding protein [Fervidobacterium sp. SC_NGM5_G05]